MNLTFIENLFSRPEALTHYSLRNLALMFFIFSVVGWVWEVIYIRITEKVIAKRGMLHGPWLPMYGLGGVAMLAALSRFQPWPMLVFVLAMLMCGTLEYFTGVAIEHFFGCRWWDYSTKRINFRGRICLSGVLLFGLSGTAAVCGFGPALNARIAALSFPIYTALIVILSAVFIVDLVWSARKPNSGKGITYEISDKSSKKEEDRQ